MKGFIKIPTYVDPECTIKYKDIRVMVLDHAQGVAMAGMYVDVGRIRVQYPHLERIGGSGPTDALVVRYPENLGGSGAATPEQSQEIRRIVKTVLGQYLKPTAVFTEFTADGFNMAAFASTDGTFYLKNGSKIVVTRKPYSYNDLSLGDGILMQLYNPSGQRVGAFGFSHISDEYSNAYLVNPPGAGYYIGSNVIGTFGMMKEAAIAYPGRNSRCGMYSFFYIFDDMQLKSNAHDACSLYTGDTGYRYIPYQEIEPQKNVQTVYPVGLLYKFLGATSNQNILDLIEDSSYVEDGPNSDDTYPGGGDDKNPYPEDGESGKGTFDDKNDEVDFPTLPTWDATSTGFIEMWNPNVSEILDLYTFMWSDQLSIWEKVKHWFNDPMDAIISLGFVPVDPTISGKRNVSLALVDTGVQMNHVSKQFVEFDFGSQVLDEYYGACWDFSPYTKVQIYLPYIGIQELDTDDVMGANLHLKYHIDLLTGATSAQLKCTRSRDKLDGIVYTWEGNCLMRIPITGADARGFMSSLIQATAIGGLSLINPAAGALSTTLNEGKGDEEKRGAVGQWTNPVMATYSAANVLGQKIHVQRGSRVDANVGVISPQCAYLIINRPISGMPKGWNEYAGYPSMKIKALSSQKGFTKVAYIKLNNLEATSEEIAELDSILKDGVIL